MQVSGATFPRRPRTVRTAGIFAMDRRAIGLYGIACVAFAFAHQGRLLELVFSAGAVVVAFLLLRHSFARYLSFVVWLFMLAPEVRRVVDFYSGAFSGQSLFMVTPLVSVMSLPLLVKRRDMLLQRRAVPLLLTGTGILYGFVMGVLNAGLFAATYDLVYWAFPILLAAAALTEWEAMTKFATQ